MLFLYIFRLPTMNNVRIKEEEDHREKNIFLKKNINVIYVLIVLELSEGLEI